MFIGIFDSSIFMLFTLHWQARSLASRRRKYGLLIVGQCSRVQPVHLMNVEQRHAATEPQTMPDELDMSPPAYEVGKTFQRLYPCSRGQALRAWLSAVLIYRK